MKRYHSGLLAAVLLALLAAAAGPARAWGSSHGKADPGSPVWNPGWPEGVRALANQRNRTGGYWVNSSDWFRYRGGAFDWQMNVIEGAAWARASLAGEQVPAKRYTVTVSLPADGRVRWRDVRVPAGVLVVRE